MIPYAIFMMNFIWKDASLEVRGLDPVEEGITFRLDRKWAVKLFLEGKPEKIECLFLENEKRTYRKVILTDFTVKENLKETQREVQRVAQGEAQSEVQSETQSEVQSETQGESLNEALGQTCADLDYVNYILTSAQTDFKAALSKLLKDYTEYIWRKLSMDELSAMEEMTGREIGEDYPASLAEWQEMMRENSEENAEENSKENSKENSEENAEENLEDNSEENSRNTEAAPDSKKEAYDLKKVDLAICLDQPKLWSAFLAKSKEEFIAYYWEQNGLTGHPITRQKVTHIYIGNNFCPLLFPSREELEKIAAKAEESDLVPVYVFSTMPEHLTAEYESRMEWILPRYAKQKENADSHIGSSFKAKMDSSIKAVPAELVFNDLGTALLWKHLADNKDGSATPIRLTLGPLATKRKKDPRIPWRATAAYEGVTPASDAAANFETIVDSSLYRAYLKERFGIEQVSYEACGYPIKITGSSNALHLPLYQTNTSGYCTLYALCKNGDREAQEEAVSCPHYCEKNYVFYPKPMPLIGRFNSLFGCSMKELNDVGILNDYIDAGIGRLVVRM